MNSFEKDPDETYRAYQRFRKRNENDKAYRCIENLLKRFPDDMELLDEIVALALGHMRAPNLARPWLVHRIGCGTEAASARGERSARRAAVGPAVGFL